MQYDASELGNRTASNVLAGSITEEAAGSLRDLFFSLSPSTDVDFAVPGAYLMTSVTFDILDPLRRFDGMADFSVGSQIGDPFQGLTTLQGDFHQFDGAAGADVGRAVPDSAVVASLMVSLLLNSNRKGRKLSRSGFIGFASGFQRRLYEARYGRRMEDGK